MTAAFREAMIKLANNGQNADELIDCSETIPIPGPWNGPPTLPYGKAIEDLEHPVSYGAAHTYFD
jgi:cytochrome c peroxidase